MEVDEIYLLDYLVIKTKNYPCRNSHFFQLFHVRYLDLFPGLLHSVYHKMVLSFKSPLKMPFQWWRKEGTRENFFCAGYCLYS